MNVHEALVKIRVLLCKAESEASEDNIGMASATISELTKVGLKFNNTGKGLCSTCLYEDIENGNDLCNSCDDPDSQWKSKTSLIAGNCRVCRHQGVKFNVEPCRSCGKVINNCEAKGGESK